MVSHTQQLGHNGFIMQISNSLTTYFDTWDPTSTLTCYDLFHYQLNV
jgi:hypothetical protein